MTDDELIDLFERTFGHVVLYGRGPVRDVAAQLRAYVATAEGEEEAP